MICNLKNTAARWSTPGCVKRNLKNFNKKAPELKLVGYPFLYIPVDIPPVSPRRGLRWAWDRVLLMCAMPPPRFVWTTHVNHPTWTASTETSLTACQTGEMWPNDTSGTLMGRTTRWSPPTWTALAETSFVFNSVLVRWGGSLIKWAWPTPTWTFRDDSKNFQNGSEKKYPPQNPL